MSSSGGGVVADLLALARLAPRALWAVYALKLLESLAYFSSSLNMALYLSEGLGYGDTAAGVLYSAWGTAAGVAGIACGPLVDWLGVQQSLVLGGICVSLGRLFFTVGDRALALTGLLVLQPLGMGLAIPVLSICIRRICETRPQLQQLRPTAYGVFYSVMNVAALAGGLLTDLLVSSLSSANGGSGEDPETLRRVFAVGTAVSVAYCIVSCAFTVDATGPQQQQQQQQQAPATLSSLPASLVFADGESVVQQTAEASLSQQQQQPTQLPAYPLPHSMRVPTMPIRPVPMRKEPAFSWIFRLFGARERATQRRVVARKMRQFWGLPGRDDDGCGTQLRTTATPDADTDESSEEHGNDGDNYENDPHRTNAAATAAAATMTWRDYVYDATLWKLAVLSMALFGARSVFRHVDATLPKYLRRTLGPGARYGLVYAVNPALIIGCVPPVQAYIAAHRLDLYACIVAGAAAMTLAPLAFVLLPTSAGYAAPLLFMLLLTAGEAVSSPLSYEYFMRLAPAGREGAYGALASAPIFFVKLLVGGMSGSLLHEFCPASGPAGECWQVWAVVSLTAATSPALLLLLRGWIYSPDVRTRVQLQ